MLFVNKIKALNEKIYSSKIDPHNNYGLIADETQRISGISKNLVETFEKIDDDFKAATKLEKTDIAFLFLATGLQCVRQYLFTNFKLKEDRPNDQDAAKNAKGKNTNKEHSDRHHRLYNPSLTQIWSNPVPFDANVNSPGALAGGGKALGHRETAIGHDPILGLVFGTANIATSTLTNFKFESYHIKTHETQHKDYFFNRADTSKVLAYTFEKMNLQNIRSEDFKEGFEEVLKVPSALIKEIIHLKSDVHSKSSLPLPFLPAIDGKYGLKLASTMAKYGLDMENILKIRDQAIGSIVINLLISWVHYLMYSEEKEGPLEIYKVRTRKILSYSNAIATSSNILGVAIEASVNAFNKNSDGVKKSLSYLDVGGFIVTLHRLISDHKFISQIKQEFIEKEMYKIIFDESLIEGV